MYKTILISSDGSELAGKAVANGLALAKSLDAKVIAVTVSEPWPPTEMAAEVERGQPHPIEDFEKAMASWAATVLEGVAAKAKDAGVTCETVHVADRHPADGIVETAKAKGCDLIVMASHGRRGVKRLLLGSVAAEVLAHSTIPVLVYR
jgi:nucleotide-binding universal stress UspA family protein